MAVLRSCEKNEKQGTHQKASLPSGYQLVQRKPIFDSFALAWSKMLALDPCNPKASRESAPKLWNQTLKFQKLLCLSNNECPRRKRKLGQFLRDSKFTAASGLALGTSSNQIVKKLDSRPFPSVSCLPHSVVTNMQTVHNSYSEGSALIIEDSFQGKQVHINFNAPDNATDRSPSNKEISPFIDTDESVNGSKPLSPEILIVQDAPLVDSNDLVRSPDQLTSEVKLGNAFRLITKDEHIEKDVIPEGPKFQAELPKWTDPVKKGNLYDGDGNSENLKWLGTRIWPMEGRRTNTIMGAVGKGRPDSCSCVSPGTADCIKHHVFEARKLLQTNLGPAFLSWKFNEMGEIVSKSWTLKEQKKFESLVKKNPLLNGTNFWESASKCFPSKCKRSILSYYYNVFLPRRMSLLTRSSLDDVDSDEDRTDCDEEEVEDEEDES